VDRITTELTSLGLSWEVLPTGTDRSTILASTGTAGPTIYLHGHYDVVPAFSAEQFRPRFEGDRLLGRGASDMKGGLAAIIHAAPGAAAAGARVRLVIVPDEETGGTAGAERLVELGLIEAGAVGAIVAEPTWGTIWHAARGAFTLDVTIRGRPAHVGLHYAGRNAFLDAFEVVDELRRFGADLRNRRCALPFASTDPRAAESIMLIGGIAGGGTNFNVVPDAFHFTVDRRPNPDEDYEAAKDELLAVFDRLRRRGLDLDVQVLQDAPSSVTSADHHFVRTVATAAESVLGAPVPLSCCPGVLETRVYAQAGIPAVAFGPGLIDQMHGPDEYVQVANLSAAASVYVEVAGLLVSGGAEG
jgi:succinyl-diaminopimelate desuccinylase